MTSATWAKTPPLSTTHLVLPMVSYGGEIASSWFPRPTFIDNGLTKESMLYIIRGSIPSFVDLEGEIVPFFADFIRVSLRSVHV